MQSDLGWFWLDQTEATILVGRDVTVEAIVAECETALGTHGSRRAGWRQTSSSQAVLWRDSGQAFLGRAVLERADGFAAVCRWPEFDDIRQHFERAERALGPVSAYWLSCDRSNLDAVGDPETDARQMVAFLNGLLRAITEGIAAFLVLGDGTCVSGEEFRARLEREPNWTWLVPSLAERDRTPFERERRHLESARQSVIDNAQDGQEPEATARALRAAGVGMVSAIKTLRELHGLSLEDAKRAWDAGG